MHGWKLTPLASILLIIVAAALLAAVVVGAWLVFAGVLAVALLVAAPSGIPAGSFPLSHEEQAEHADDRWKLD